MIMTAIADGGHILIEDMPGIGKTTMALALSDRGQFGLQVQDIRISWILRHGRIRMGAEY